MSQEVWKAMGQVGVGMLVDEEQQILFINPIMHIAAHYAEHFELIVN
jgi:hypothetical protein